MCLNCGCGIYDDDMGNKDNLVIEDLVKAAQASSMNGQDTLKEIQKSLENIKVEDLESRIQKNK